MKPRIYEMYQTTLSVQGSSEEAMLWLCTSSSSPRTCSAADSHQFVLSRPLEKTFKAFYPCCISTSSSCLLSYSKVQLEPSSIIHVQHRTGTR